MKRILGNIDRYLAKKENSRLALWFFLALNFACTFVFASVVAYVVFFRG